METKHGMSEFATSLSQGHAYAYFTAPSEQALRSIRSMGYSETLDIYDIKMTYITKSIRNVRCIGICETHFM